MDLGSADDHAHDAMVFLERALAMPADLAAARSTGAEDAEISDLREQAIANRAAAQVHAQLAAAAAMRDLCREVRDGLREVRDEIGSAAGP